MTLSTDMLACDTTVYFLMDILFRISTQPVMLSSIKYIPRCKYGIQTAFLRSIKFIAKFISYKTQFLHMSHFKGFVLLRTMEY